MTRRVSGRTLSGERPGILAIFIDDTDRSEWRGLRDRLELEGEARQFLAYKAARPVIAVTCASRFELFGMADAAEEGELRFRNSAHPAAKAREGAIRERHPPPIHNSTGPARISAFSRVNASSPPRGLPYTVECVAVERPAVPGCEHQLASNRLAVRRTPRQRDLDRVTLCAERIGASRPPPVDEAATRHRFFDR
jgi:hypothetical protein